MIKTNHERIIRQNDDHLDPDPSQLRGCPSTATLPFRAEGKAATILRYRL